MTDTKKTDHVITDAPAKAKVNTVPEKQEPEVKPLGMVMVDPMIAPYEGELRARIARYEDTKQRLTQGKSLKEFANGHMFYGFHKTETGWVYREWAPAARSMHLYGDFNNWNPASHPMKSLGDGSWEIEIEGTDTLKHLSGIKVLVTGPTGNIQTRIPLYATYVVQNTEDTMFTSRIWDPESPFVWTDEAFSPQSNWPPLIYEAHVGMATEEKRIGTYLEFRDHMLPRIKDAGYNTIQLMAIMEHPYYGSFGYQVSNFFAASSKFGTPDDLKSLVNTAHEMGISVLLDIVHSHAVGNYNEGINCFDGTEYQFFHAGGKGNHPSWGTKCFDYGRTGVIHYLLSNVKFWMDEYHFDGFRFDGVTSMLYHDHAMGTAFTGYEQYFSMNTDVDAVTYLMLAGELVHENKKGSICIAEDMSGMPGMCAKIENGGIGFDFRLSMGIPDYFVKSAKERSLGNWNMGQMCYEMTSHRPNEGRVAYVESHDQALVGDKTLIFRLADDQIYWNMGVNQNNMACEMAIAVSKLSRFITITMGGDGYLNFMGNEFGHPEWIDFPREGNGWSYDHARRLWSVGDNEDLRFHYLKNFDRAMVNFAKDHKILAAPDAQVKRVHETDQIIIYEKAGFVFAFNFHPNRSQQSLFVPVSKRGDYEVIFSSDEKAYGGYGNVDMTAKYNTLKAHPDLGDGFRIYLPAMTAVVLKCTKEAK